MFLVLPQAFQLRVFEAESSKPNLNATIRPMLGRNLRKSQQVSNYTSSHNET